MQNNKKVRICIIIVLGLIISSVLPLNYSSAADNKYNVYGLRNPTIGTSDTKWNRISFGHYYQSSSTKKTPIIWNVLWLDGKDAFLLADKCLDCQPYNESTSTQLTWSNSTLRTWLNTTFYNAAFSDSEKDAIIQTQYTKICSDNVSIPSRADIVNEKFGFDITNDHYGTYDSYDVEYTNYAIKNGASGESWWLRDISSITRDVAYVKNCRVYDKTMPASISDIAVRPVIHIDLSQSEVWSKELYEAPGILKKTSGKHYVKIIWDKDICADGYEIRLNGSIRNKTEICKKTKKSTYIFRGLKRKSSYWFDIRSYKKVNGKKIYGEWHGDVNIYTK